MNRESLESLETVDPQRSAVTDTAGTVASPGSDGVPALTASPESLTSSPHAVEPDTDRVSALCDRVRQLAQATGEERLAQRRREADQLIAAARETAAARRSAELDRVRRQCGLRIARALQKVRLEARAQLDRRRWELLNEVLDEATRAADALPRTDPDRYRESLKRAIDSAVDVLGHDALTAYANARDLPLLRSLMAEHSVLQAEIHEDDLASGVVLTTGHGNRVLDHSVAARRHRLEMALRLAASEMLFSQ